ncbi:MAG TPA: glycosyltransferase [Candidatus Omnitrophota bacterium]|nr:glycosyltransferase [Candidatus Omnitrophota bacterium]
MKICYLLPKMGIGGAERHVLSLAAGLRARGHDAGIACVFEEGRLEDEIRSKGIPLENLNLPARWDLATLFKIWKWLRAKQIDVLHTYLFGLDFFGVFPARLLKIPVIISSRREIALWQKRRHLMMVQLGNFFVDHVVCCSQAVREWVLKKEKISGKRASVIRNGVDFNRFRNSSRPDCRDKIRQEFGIPAKSFLIGTVANFSIEKGYPYLIDAAAIVLKKRPDARFLFIGGGPLLGEMKQKAEAVSPEGGIIFTGYRSDIPDLIAAMDVFVLASLIEGFPNALLEAMAMGTPVVATETGGIPELVRSGVDGVLVPPKNGERLAETVLTCLNDQQMAQKLGENARNKITNDFSLKRMLDQYEEFYQSLLSQCSKISLRDKDYTQGQSRKAGTDPMR